MRKRTNYSLRWKGPNSISNCWARKWLMRRQQRSRKRQRKASPASSVRAGPVGPALLYGWLGGLIVEAYSRFTGQPRIDDNAPEQWCSTRSRLTGAEGGGQ